MCRSLWLADRILWNEPRFTWLSGCYRQLINLLIYISCSAIFIWYIHGFEYFLNISEHESRYFPTLSKTTFSKETNSTTFQLYSCFIRRFISNWSFQNFIDTDTYHTYFWTSIRVYLDTDLGAAQVNIYIQTLSVPGYCWGTFLLLDSEYFSLFNVTFKTY